MAEKKVDPDETACDKPSHLELHCKRTLLVCVDERVKQRLV